MTKFRIWDKQANRFYYENPASLHCVSQFMICPFSGEVYDFVTSIDMDDIAYPGKNDFYFDKAGGIVHDTRYIANQWSGVKDYNGRDIYEGDICKLNDTDCKELIGEVFFKDGIFFFTRKNLLYLAYCGPITTRRLNVIGNIYENPNLINEQAA